MTAVIIAALLLVFFPASTPQAALGNLPGLVGPTFNLKTATGRYQAVTGQSVLMWGYAPNPGNFQYPGPNLIVTQGQTVTINLTNNLSERVSIAFPGQASVTANGNPVAPEFDVSGNVISLTTSVAPGGTITYSFVASQPGTYLYESGTDPEKQIQMGLFGALIIKPAGHADWAYDDSRTRFNPNAEYLLLYHEIDPVIHDAVEGGFQPDMKAYWPRYWTVNGRSFPDTVAPDNVNSLPAQPYGSLVAVYPRDASTNPYPALIRVANAGLQITPIHPHGAHSWVIGHDGRQYVGPGGEDLTRDEFTLILAPGQTFEFLWWWEDIHGYNPDTNPVPLPLPDLRNLTTGEWYSGSPYLGGTGDLPILSVEMGGGSGAFFFPWHSHSERQMALWFGAGMAGSMTAVVVLPPAGM